MNKILKNDIKKINQRRIEIKQYYIDKFYNLFMSKYKCKELDYQQFHFLFSRLYQKGTIAGFVVENTKGELMPNGLLVLTDYAPMNYNIYNFPIAVNLINRRGVNFIPQTPLFVDEDVVLGYIQPTHKGILQSIEPILEKIVNLEILIDNQITLMSCSWLIAGSPEDEERLTRLMNDIIAGKSTLFVSASDVAKLKAFVNNSPFYADKIHDTLEKRVNEVLTYLGINNNSLFKKEHLIVDEVNANNELIEQHEDIFLTYLKEFATRVKSVFNIQLTFEPVQDKQPTNEDDLKGSDEDDV